MVQFLHVNEADIQAEDNFAIRFASENGYLEVVQFLHANGADILPLTSVMQALQDMLPPKNG